MSAAIRASAAVAAPYLAQLKATCPNIGLYYRVFCGTFAAAATFTEEDNKLIPDIVPKNGQMVSIWGRLRNDPEAIAADKKAKLNKKLAAHNCFFAESR